MTAKAEPSELIAPAASQQTGEHHVRWQESEEEGREKRDLLLLVLGVAIGLMPIANMVYLIVAVGENNISNDYAPFVGMIDRMLSGTYDWRTFLSDSFIRTHMVALEILTHLFIAKVFAWNAKIELLIGAVVAGLRTLFLCLAFRDAVTRSWRPILYGCIAALTFSTSQSCVFLYGEASIAIGLAMLGFALALWGLIRFAPSTTGVVLACLGGIISSYSWGNAFPCWFVLFLGMVALGYRRVTGYLTFAVGTAIGVFPYFYFLVTRSADNPGVTRTFSFLNSEFVINALGRPFANGIGYPWNCGSLPFAEGAAVMLLVAFAGCMALMLIRRQITPELKGAILLFVYGVSSLYVIGLFRNTVAPWYAVLGMMSWLGLVVAAFALVRLFRRDAAAASSPEGVTADQAFAAEMDQGSGAGYIPIVGTSFACLTLVAIFILYAVTNRTYQDKHFYLSSRGPSSEATLRNYLTAPTYSESNLTNFGDGNPYLMKSFGDPLRRHHLSALGDDQAWALQGEFALARVQIRGTEHGGRAIWLDGAHPKHRSSWKNFKHLNLLVQVPAYVEWKLRIPENATQAKLTTAVGTDAVSSSFRRPSYYQIAAQTPDGIELLSHATVSNSREWKSVSIDLLPYKGKDITLLFGSSVNEKSPGGSVLFRYPAIAVKLSRPDNRPEPDAEMRPENCDLSPQFPTTSNADYVFPLVTANNFVESRYQFFLGQDAGGKLLNDLTREQPIVSLKQPLDVKLADYSHFYVDMSCDPSLPSRALRVRFDIEGKSPVWFSIPLLPDSSPHKFVYELKLLELDGNERLKGIMLFPVSFSGDQTKMIQVKELRLLRKR